MTDYSFYSTVYGGKTPEADFNRLVHRATASLSALTMGRSDSANLKDPIPQFVELAICEIVDVYYKAEQGSDVVSESNDGMSRTYAAKVQRTEEQQVLAAASKHLAWTGLLYRGCCF